MSKAKCSVFFLCLFFAVFGASAQQAQVPVDSPKRLIYTYVEQMPEPSVDLRAYFEKNIVYPKKALEDNVEGRATVKFIVHEDGTTSNFQIVRSISDECDKEAIRVLKSLPPWKPGKQNGKAVPVYFTLPVVFRHP